MTVNLRAPAKINPVLRVLGRRDDGFHDLVTVMVALELAGDVAVERLPADAPGGVRVTVDGPYATDDIPRDEGNLAARAALAIRAYLGSDDPLSVALTKRVPSRAGLGGGSSDAAAAALGTLEALDAHGDPAARSAAQRLLAEIGSDCSFFHVARTSGAALATGRGTQLTTLPAAPRWWVSLVTPDVDASTPAVYGALGLAKGARAAVEPEAAVGFASPDAGERAAAAHDLLTSGADVARALLINDLESAARRAYPDLDAWFEFARRAGVPAMTLAGSGATLFGIHDHEAEARDTVDRVVRAAADAGRTARFSGVTRTSSGWGA